ncbi:TPM domain-containing protein [bacterium]|nr:TPM domain-containing protein [bacterium]MDY3022878.1 TPM domain-containing protein [Oliverpabstia sp.]
MKKIRWITGILPAVCFFLLLIMGRGTITVHGAQSDSIQHVVDQADILTSQEEQAIGNRIEEMSEKWKQDFVVVTTYDAEGKDSEEYADDYYDDHGYQENGILYLVDLDNSNVWISTSGSMIRFLTDSRIDRVIDAGYSQLKSQNYGEGFLAMLDQTDTYMEAGILDNQYTYDVETGKVNRHYGLTAGEIIVALLVGLACGGIFFGVINARYKMRTGTYTYPFREKGKIQLIRRDDIFVNQTVTRRRIERNPPSGGGGRSSVHTSGSGRSHGGGGRSL